MPIFERKVKQGPFQIGLLFVALLCVSAISSCGRNAAEDDSGSDKSVDLVTQTSSDMVEWLVPAVTELPLRSDEEKAAGMAHGRTPPEREFLQPPLDPKLESFVANLDPTTTASLIGGASDVLPDLVKAWIVAFNQIYPNIEIKLGTPYAGSLGMLEVIDGKYDFVFVSRELKPTDLTQFENKYGYAPFSVAISGASFRHYGFLDAIGFFVHVDNPLDKITLGQIDAIYSSTRHRGLGPITSWGDLGLTGPWATQPINAYGVEPWNGFEEFVRQRVLDFAGQRGEWHDGVEFSHTAFPIAEKVALDANGIGYTGLAYLDRGVKVLPIVSESGDVIAASYENVAKATYPLSRLIYFNANKSPENGLDPVLDEFVRFILSRQGQQIVLDRGIYLPLRAWQANASQVELEQ